MKKMLVAMMVVMVSLIVTINEAEARRMGGGGSFGRQSQNVTRQVRPAQPPSQATNPNQAKPAAPAATPQGATPRPASPWRNILGGALLGLGLGALLSHLGIGGALASAISTILMIALLALAAMFIYRMFKRKSDDHGARPAYAGAYGSAGPDAVRTPEIGSGLETGSRPAAFQAEHVSAATADEGNWNVPADFDVPGFLRNAKTYFIRLQAAWDRADINDIREFTTPEMFAELRLQLQERGASANHTDVMSVEADLLGVETTERDYLASVRFSGMIKEAEDAPAQAFAEVWNLVKARDGQGGWLLAGIQQLSDTH